MSTYVVVAAAIVDGVPARLLAAQRSYPDSLAGRWELPGGKAEAGEDEVTALARECAEELAVTVLVGDRAAGDVPTTDGRGVLRTYWATLAGDASPQPLEHAELRWLTLDELYDVDWLDADLPVVAELAEGIASRE